MKKVPCGTDVGQPGVGAIIRHNLYQVNDDSTVGRRREQKNTVDFPEDYIKSQYISYNYNIQLQSVADFAL